MEDEKTGTQNTKKSRAHGMTNENKKEKYPQLKSIFLYS